VRILLADDSVTAQNMGKKILAEAGHEITTVSNGAAAMKKISETRPDLIILDIYMPGYTGLEVCQRVKESRDIARTPVLLTVGKLEPFKKEDARRVRAEAVVVKPFEASELLAAVNKIAEYVVARPAEAKKGSLRERAERAQAAGDQWDGAEASAAATGPAAISEPAPPVQEVVAVQSQPSAETHDASPAAENELRGSAFAEEIVQLQPISRAHSSSAKPAVVAPSSFEVHAEAQSVQQQARQSAEAPLARAAATSAAAESAIGSHFPDISGGGRGADQRPEFSIQAPEAPVAREPLPVIPTSFMPAEVEHPAPDPAFIADRNQALTSFPTHFGIRQAEAPAPADVPASAAQDDVESALASLPGDSPGLGAAAGSAWIAEELPIEAGEEALSLEQEMSQAHAALASDAAAGSEPAPDAVPEFQITPELPIAAGNNGDDKLEHDFSESFAPGSQRISIGDADLPDFAGVEAELPAILPAEPVESTPASPAAASIPEMSAADMAALERVVARVLDQLKPKIVAEIAREIAAGKK
jgi:CheY-like chemotaxis protein